MSLANTSNPFVGLRPFESDESLLFFGRQEQTLQLLQRLHQHHFVAVVGSSGSGKSSLIRAGLIPSLKAGYLVDDRDKWIIAIMKPGQSPLYNLAESLLHELHPGDDAVAASDLVKKIEEEGADAVLDVLKPSWKKNYTNFFLLVDQFEELFRFSMDQKDVAKKDEAIDFVNIILELSQQTGLPVYIVITMRSDFIGDCAQFYGLPEAMNQSQYLVPKLNRVQVKNAIEGPVKLYGGKIDPVLTSRLLNDVAMVKDELPLMQHALMRVWDHEVNEDKNDILDLKDYESIGGIEKALSNHADEALEGMSDAELNLTKKMFQALTAIDENGRKIRRPVRLTELGEITGAHKEQLLPIINRFIENKRSFLMISKVGVEDDLLIDISHESLIRQWGTLNGWVDEEAEASKNYLRLVESTNLHRAEQKDFMTGVELQLALQWYAKFKPVPVWAKRYHPEFEESKQYLRQSENEWKRAEQKKKSDKKKKVLLIIGGIAAVIIALLLNNINQTRLKDIAKVNEQKAIEAKNEADTSRRNALEQKNIAERNALEADSARKEADLFALAAIAAKDDANTALATADSALILAISSQAKTETQKEAFRLISLARQKVVEDPTIALRVAEAAMNTFSDSLISEEANKIYTQNAFYKTIIHGDNFTSFAMSPKRTEILTASEDGKVRLWNKNGNLLQEFKAHANQINLIDFSPDGSKILTSSDDTTRLWNKNGGLLKEFNIDTGYFYSVAFSPDGTEILAGLDDGTARLWRIDGDPIREFKTDSVAISSEAFSQDGLEIVIGYDDGTARVWNKNGDLLHEFKGPKAAIYAIAFSPDGIGIFTGYDDGTARLWNKIDSSYEIFEGHNDIINSVAFSPNGTKILTTSSDETARLWDFDGTQLMEFKGNEGEIYFGAFSLDGTEIFTGSADGMVRLWDIRILQPKELKIGSVNITSTAFSPDGTKILTSTSSGTAAKLWSLDSSKLIKNFIGHTSYINSVAFSPDGKKILTGSSDKTVILWSVDGIKLKEFKEFMAVVRSVAFSPDGTKFLVGSANSIATLWKLDGTQLGEFTGHRGSIMSVAFSPDGTKVLTGSSDKTAILWKIDGKRLMQFKGHTSYINSIAFSPDGTKILTGSSDKTAILWRQDGPILQKFKHFAIVHSAVFSPDGTKILTGSSDRTAVLWSTEGLPLRKFKGNSTAVHAVAFSPNGKKILVCSDQTARLWDLISITEFLRNNRIDNLTDEQKGEFGIKEKKN